MVDRRSRPSTPRFVIVTPVYDEVDCLPLYVEAVTRIILDRQDVAASVLFIDDGSTDKSWNAIEELCDRDKRFQGIRLSRNVGSHTATMAAFHNLPEDVDAAVIMGCDLQDPPETALALLDEWRSGADIVWGQRRTRDDPVVRRVGSKVFHALLRRSMPQRVVDHCRRIYPHGSTGRFSSCRDERAESSHVRIGGLDRIRTRHASFTIARNG